MIANKLTTIILAFLFLSPYISAQTLVDNQATTETKSLYKFLQSIQGKNIMMGHQDDTAYGIGWKYEPGQSDIKKVAGDYPAVYGWELGHIELGDSASLDDLSFERIRNYIIDAHNRGGINTISWHLRNPLTGDSSWDVSSDQVVRSIIPGGQNHELYKQWLDRLAVFFHSLKSGRTPVPVLFRPFHEHTGSWFWWGKNLCSREDYIQLWQFTVEYLRDRKNVHNLLYIYSPDRVPSKEEYFERYPGDNYVDILGLDLYHRNGEAGAEDYIAAVQNVLKILADYTRTNKKPFVFSETGSEQLPMNKWFTEVLWRAMEPNKPCYVLLWRNAYERPSHYYAPFPGHPVNADFIQFKESKNILFEKDVRRMRK